MSSLYRLTLRMQLLKQPLVPRCPVLLPRSYVAPLGENLRCSLDQIHTKGNSLVSLGPHIRLHQTLRGEGNSGGKCLRVAWKENLTLNKVAGAEEPFTTFTRHNQGNLGRARQHVRRVAQSVSLEESAVLPSAEGTPIPAIESTLGVKLGQGPMIPEPKPLVIIISGPSGVGKDAVIKRLQEGRKELQFVVTATSRPQRPGEVHGIDYLFVSRDEFQKMIAADELLEHAVVYGDFKGIPKQQVRDGLASGRDVVLRLDVQGAATLRSILGKEAVFIFLVAESEVALVQRLVERKTETMEKILVRVGTARKETMRLDEFDYVVVNKEGEIDRTVGAIVSIIDAEKARVVPKQPKL